MANGERHVVFGTGPVGRAVMSALVEKGRAVRMVNTSGQADVPQGVEVVGGDASDPAFSRSVCRDAAVVYNALNAPYHRWPELFPPLHQAVLAAATAAGARLVWLDNLDAYGPTGGRPLTEDLPYAASFAHGLTRARLAEELLEAHTSGRVQVAIGRASDFFGPGVLRAAMGEGVFYPALSGGIVQVIGNPDLPHTQTYVPDIGRALVLLGEQEQALGQVWHIPSPRTVTTREFIALVYQAAGNEPFVRRTPRWLLWLLALKNPMLRPLKHTLYQFEQPFIMDHGKFQRAFDFQPTPLEEAIAATVAWYRQRPRY